MTTTFVRAESAARPKPADRPSRTANAASSGRIGPPILRSGPWVGLWRRAPPYRRRRPGERCYRLPRDGCLRRASRRLAWVHPQRPDARGGTFMIRFLLTTLAAGLAAAAVSAADPRKPNVIIFLADDLGYGEVGFQGNKDIPTPHLDALAATGVRFKQGYVAANYCSPSRAGLMSGNN